MKITVFGSTDLTLKILEFLFNQNFTISAIVTAPQNFVISYKLEEVKNSRFVDLKKWAQDKSTPIFLYKNADQLLSEFEFQKLNSEFAIVAGWYHMIPQKLRKFFSIGCAGFHSSLLPKLRGGAPLNWALLLKLKETGMSFFELSDGIDDGLLYDQEKFLIQRNEIISDLIQKSTLATLNILKRSLPKIKNGSLIKYQQIGIPSYCGQRIPEDSLINWNCDCDEVIDLIRASSKPYSGAYTYLGQDKIIIWNGTNSDIQVHGVPGQIMIVENKIYVCCRKGSIRIIDADSSLLLKSNHRRFKND